MENFNFISPTKIVFGKDSHLDVGKLVGEYSKKILLHYEGDGSLIKKLGIYEKVLNSLKKENIEIIELGGVVPNPRLSLVNEGIKICKEEKIEFILAIGGGSVIDSSKAIALGTVYDGNVWDFFTGKNTPKSSLGVGVVLTIPGSGSEMSESSIITDELNELKCVCDTEKNFPKFSILDPEVCFSIPDSLMGAGVADILSHLMERYFSQSIHTELSDSLMEAAMRTVIKFGPKIMKNRKDYNNCAQIMWAATVAHNGMIACGRVADWSSHRIEHEISGIYDITHGAGMAIIFPTWIDYVKDDNIEVMNRFSKEVFGVNTISEGIKELKKFFKELGLKEKLSDFNITNEKFELMAEKALAGSETLGRFKKLSKEDLIKIMEISK
ncbi:MAG: iron-containing alcohol dehydrogenase [Fusobacterium sp. JB021]|nr:iron-containing alcohol dehydrogenase [Fusobacterium sp. JB020]MDP0493412.1 iron-containing alcohol dehydrogenase [Fusobacterium sp. JB021]MDP0507646.1 iron-containing alcohol dehydrogenase [Fusobacterium sp. JB019]